MHLRFAAILVFAFGMIGIVVARPFDGRDRRAERSAMSTDHDWPQWQGPDRTGLSKETGLLQQWLDTLARLVHRRPDSTGQEQQHRHGTDRHVPSMCRCAAFFMRQEWPPATSKTMVRPPRTGDTRLDLAEVDRDHAAVAPCDMDVASKQPLLFRVPLDQVD